MTKESSSKSITSESILNNQDLAETLPENMGIAFHWVARNFGQSIGEKNVERVQKFAKLEPQRTFYVVVHGLEDEQVNELNSRFSCCSNVKVIKFNSLKLGQHDLPLFSYTVGNNLVMRLSQYWNNMYSEKVKKRRMHFSNEIDLMKYHLAIHSDQIVGINNPLAVFDFDTLPAEGKKIGEVKIIKGGVLLAYLHEGVDRNARLDLPILAVSKGGNAILQGFQEIAKNRNDSQLFFKTDQVAQKLISKIKAGNVSNLLRLIGVDHSFPGFDEIYDQVYKGNRLLAFNRDENVIIISDKSWHYGNNVDGTAEQSVPSSVNPAETTTPIPTQQKQP